jgi:hypothetical protein
MRLASGFGYGCLAIAVACSAADPPAKPDEPAVQQALRELDHAEWSVREQATQTLERAGAAVVKSLAQRAATGSPEAAVRATEVLAAFYAEKDFTAVDELESELEALIVAKGSVGEFARRGWEDRRADREQRALVRIEQLGGTILYPMSPRNQLLDDQPPGLRPIDSVVLTRRWKGGDDGLRYVRRLNNFDLQRRIYRVNGSPVSDAAVEQLEQAGFHVEPRGARLGVINSMFTGVEVEGCEVGGVKAGSPAEKAGIQDRDVIVGFGDRDVKDFSDLIELLKAAEPGQKVVLVVHRGDEVLNVSVELDDWLP